MEDYQKLDGSQTGFNGRLLITEEFFVENISGMHNDDITELPFPDDIQRGLKFVYDKETIFLGYILLDPIYSLDDNPGRLGITNIERDMFV